MNKPNDFIRPKMIAEYEAYDPAYFAHYNASPNLAAGYREDECRLVNAAVDYFHEGVLPLLAEKYSYHVAELVQILKHFEKLSRGWRSDYTFRFSSEDQSLFPYFTYSDATWEKVFKHRGLLVGIDVSIQMLVDLHRFAYTIDAKRQENTFYYDLIEAWQSNAPTFRRFKPHLVDYYSLRSSERRTSPALFRYYELLHDKLAAQGADKEQLIRLQEEISKLTENWFNPPIIIQKYRTGSKLFKDTNFAPTYGGYIPFASYSFPGVDLQQINPDDMPSDISRYFLFLCLNRIKEAEDLILTDPDALTAFDEESYRQILKFLKEYKKNETL